MQEAYHFSPFLSRSPSLSFSLPTSLYIRTYSSRSANVSLAPYLAYLRRSRRPDPSQGVLPRVQLNSIIT